MEKKNAGEKCLKGPESQRRGSDEKNRPERAHYSESRLSDKEKKQNECTVLRNLAPLGKT